MTTHTENAIRNRFQHINTENHAIINLADAPNEVLITDDAGRSVFEMTEMGNESSMWMHMENAIKVESPPPSMHDTSVYHWDNYTPDPNHAPKLDAQPSSHGNKWLIGGATAAGVLLASMVIGQSNDGGNDITASSTNRLRPMPYIRYIKSHESEESVIQAMNEQHLKPTSLQLETWISDTPEPTAEHHLYHNAETPPIILDEPTPPLI